MFNLYLNACEVSNWQCYHDTPNPLCGYDKQNHLNKLLLLFWRVLNFHQITIITWPTSIYLIINNNNKFSIIMYYASLFEISKIVHLCSVLKV